MGYTAQAITNGNGDRAFFMGLDLGNLKPECALGDASPTMKDVVLESRVYTVGQLLNPDLKKPSRPYAPKKPSKNCSESKMEIWKRKMELFEEKMENFDWDKQFKVEELYRNAMKYDLILNIMLRDGVVDFDTKVKVGAEGRLCEVYLVKEKEAYRVFGTTYYGKV